MEYLDFLVLAVGGITIFEAARRLYLINLANKLRNAISNMNEEGIQDNCISYKIFYSSGEGSKWSPGIGAAINDRPFVIFILIIITLGVFGAVLTLIASYPKISILIMAIVFSATFHSGPDTISTEERYLEVIVAQDQNKMNGHDLKILTKSINEYRSWPSYQLIFGLAFVTSIFWIESFLFVGFLIILIAGFCVLGSKYSIQKGIFESAPGI